MLLVNKNYFAMFNYSLHGRFSHDSDFDFMITLSLTSVEGGTCKILTGSLVSLLQNRNLTIVILGLLIIQDFRIFLWVRKSTIIFWG